MENLKSPLNSDELLKIDEYIKNNNQKLLKLPLEYYSDLRVFQPKNADFEKFIKDLSVNEKTRAWFYLYTNAKKLRETSKNVRPDTNIEPNYNFILEKEKTNIWPLIIKILIVIIVVALTLYMCTPDKSKKPTEQDYEINRQLVSIDSVKKLLKDPDSAEFRNMKGLCGEVNSKNGFGAFTGYKRYIGSPDITVIEGETEGLDQTTFNEVWSKICK